MRKEGHFNGIPLLLILAVGAIALALRPPGTWAAVGLTALVGLVGIAAPVSVAPAVASWPRWLIVLGVGVAPFAAVRFAGLAFAVAPVWLPAAAANVAAAVAEEAFFRRLGFGALARWGTGAAILGAAAAFALVHVPVYGWNVVPIDLAAGLILGWQRWASGGWSAPALTHVAGNLLQMG